ncbi:3,9-dihydroxypterocarpan 6A-monooxygenase [Bertholletia excelsa]
MTDYHSFLTLFLIWVTTTVLLRIILRRPWNKALLPPGPPALPIIGHFYLLSRPLHQSLYNLSRRHGPLFLLRLGFSRVIIVSSPETARELLQTNEASFSSRAPTESVRMLAYGSKDFAFAPYGPYWKFMKKLCVSQLLGGRTLELLLPIRRQEISLFVKLLFEKAKAQEAIDLRGELMRLTNNVITKMVMSKSCSENEAEAEGVRKLIIEMGQVSGQFNLADYFEIFKKFDLQGFKKRTDKIRSEFDDMMDRIIEEHEEARKKKKKECDDCGGEERASDLLDIMLSIAEDKGSETRLTKENIKAFIMDVFFGGTDTSAITMEWALAELINHPNLMEKAQQEIDTVVGKNRLVEESDIPKLSYLQAIVKETLRLHPASPIINRQSCEASTVMGYHVPARTQLFVNVWALGRDPAHWTNPLEFDPGRFMGKEGGGKGLDVRGQHFHLLPFGSGRRGCPGTSLALMVVQTSLAAMIQCFEWRVSDGNKMDMEEGSGILLNKARPLVCVAEPRFDLIS